MGARVSAIPTRTFAKGYHHNSNINSNITATEAQEMHVWPRLRLFCKTAPAMRCKAAPAVNSGATTEAPEVLTCIDGCLDGVLRFFGEFSEFYGVIRRVLRLFGEFFDVLRSASAGSSGFFGVLRSSSEFRGQFSEFSAFSASSAAMASAATGAMNYEGFGIPFLSLGRASSWRPFLRGEAAGAGFLLRPYIHQK